MGTRDPVGTRVSFGGLTDLWAEVVGVVGDVRHFGPGTPAPPEIYWPAAQLGSVPGETLARLRRNLALDLTVEKLRGQAIGAGPATPTDPSSLDASLCA